MKCLEKKYTIKEIFKNILKVLLCISFPAIIVWIIWTQPINTKELIEPIKGIINYNLALNSLSTFFLACIFGGLLMIAFGLEEIIKLLRGKK